MAKIYSLVAGLIGNVKRTHDHERIYFEYEKLNMDNLPGMMVISTIRVSIRVVLNLISISCKNTVQEIVILNGNLLTW